MSRLRFFLVLSIIASAISFYSVSFSQTPESSNSIIRTITFGNSHGQYLSVAAADFDEDGIQDLVIGMKNARLLFFRGNARSIYPNGKISESPFFEPREIETTHDPDYLAAGDFDADGHYDLIAAKKGGISFQHLPGNGKGGFRKTIEAKLSGSVSALIAADINRRDGLMDFVVGINNDTAAKALIFEGPNGALHSQPEEILLPGDASSFATGQLDNDYEIDLAIAAGSDLVVVKGRDRKLSQDQRTRSQISAAETHQISLTEKIASISIHDSLSLTVQSEAGELLNLRNSGKTVPGTTAPEWAIKSRSKNSFDNQAKYLPMRLNSDALTDFIILKDGEEPVAALTVANSTISVNSTADSNVRDSEITLREAILIANGTLAKNTLTAAEQLLVAGNPAAGLDAIHFAIPGAGVPTISIGSLPTITDIVEIDGTTQSAGRVELNGTTGFSGQAFNITAGSSLVRGMAIYGIPNASGLAIRLATSGNNIIEGNYLGLNASGVAAQSTGINIQLQSGDNLIGGTAAQARNVISNCRAQAIYISGAANNNLIQGNYIGTDPTGLIAAGNAQGIRIFSPSINNTIGGTTAGSGNVIASCGDDGIDLATTGNLVQGNLIGLGANGTTDLGNAGDGIFLSGGTNFIGGTTALSRNVISGNGGNGIKLEFNAASNNIIQGNYIGTNSAGTSAFPNFANGIFAVASNNNTIGGAVAGAGNLISGNGQDGIQIGNSFFDTTGNVIQGNLIGTDVTGTVRIQNVGDGLDLAYRYANHLIGGTDPLARNVISGNGENGIRVKNFGATNTNSVHGNFIGTNIFGTGPLGNSQNGVLNDGSNFTGIFLGGVANGQANTIAFNNGDGISGQPSSTINSFARGNRIFSNNGLGIDIRSDGVTANQAGRADNFPVLTSATNIFSSTNVIGNLNSAAGTYSVDFYSSVTCDPSGNGEGEVFVGTTSIVTNGTNNANINFNIAPQIPGGRFITAVAVAADGLTSEFSNCKQVEGDEPPPPDDDLALHIIAPGKGGNSGRVTVRITGQGMDQGAIVKLSRNGEADILAQSIGVNPTGTFTMATFEFDGTTEGFWNLTVTNPDTESATLSNAFEVEPKKADQLWAELIGPKLAIIRRPTTFYIVYGNRGNTNLYGVPLFIGGIPASATVELGFEITTPQFFPDNPPINFNQLDDVTINGQEKLIALFLPVIPPGVSGVLPITIKVPTEQPVTFRYGFSNPWMTVGANGLQLSSGFQPQFDDCMQSIISIVTSLIPGLDCLAAIGNLLYDAVETVEDETRQSIWGFGESLVQTVIECGGESLPILKAYDLAIQVFNILYANASFYRDCWSLIWEKSTEFAASRDPNDKVGSGLTDSGYIPGDSPLQYYIYFENMASATLPAQEVFITDQLDPAKMDLSTLSLGPIVFGDHVVTPPVGAAQFNTDLDLRPDQDLIVRIKVELDQPSNTLKWSLQSIDPATGELPQDPLVGILPPNINPPEGEGHVVFNVMPKAGLPTGTVIQNQARIIFDLNDPIDTGTWLNTIDITSPESELNPIPAASCEPNFDLTWSGSDEGSGIQTYDIFASQDGGPFVRAITNSDKTSGIFRGRPGSSYSFYSIAKDLVRNTEDKSPVVEATATSCALFFDSFDDSDASDWSSTKPEAWSVTGETLIGISNKKADILSPFAGCSGSCTMEFDVILEAPKTTAILLGWFFDKKNFVEIQIKETKILLKQKAKSIVAKKSVKMEIPLNVVHRVSVNFDGSAFHVSVNGQNVLDVPTTVSPSGTIGARVKKGQASFPEFVVF
jgi:hypothetical protein